MKITDETKLKEIILEFETLINEHPELKGNKFIDYTAFHQAITELWDNEDNQLKKSIWTFDLPYTFTINSYEVVIKNRKVLSYEADTVEDKRSSSFNKRAKFSNIKLKCSDDLNENMTLREVKISRVASASRQRLKDLQEDMSSLIERMSSLQEATSAVTKTILLLDKIA